MACSGTATVGKQLPPAKSPAELADLLAAFGLLDRPIRPTFMNRVHSHPTNRKNIKGLGPVEWLEPGYHLHHAVPSTATPENPSHGLNRVLPVQVRGHTRQSRGTGVFLPRVPDHSNLKDREHKKREQKKQVKKWQKSCSYSPPELNLPAEWTY